MPSMDTKTADVKYNDDAVTVESRQGYVRDGDAALKFLKTEAEVGEADTVDDKKLLKKIDRTIVPLMFCCYFLQYLDKSLCKSFDHVFEI